MNVEHWMNKFEIDMEAQDLKIAKIKNKYQDILNKRQKLEETVGTCSSLLANLCHCARDSFAYFSLIWSSTLTRKIHPGFFNPFESHFSAK